MRTFPATLLLAALVLPAVLTAPPTAEAATLPTLGPGDAMSDPSRCTFSYIYDGVGALAGRVYIGTAGHCVEHVGQTVSSPSHFRFGTVAFDGSDAAAATDFAFVEVKPEFVPLLRASVKGYPGFPTGSTRSTETATGDLVYVSGHGMGFEFTAATREKRVATLLSDSPTTFNLAPSTATPGDSGGPFIHAKTGKALGIVSRGLPIGYDTGPTVEGILAKADAAGFTVTLRTV